MKSWLGSARRELAVELATAELNKKGPSEREDSLMISMYALWLPILLSAVIVFVASSVIHMAPLWHKNDYPKTPDENRLRDALRPLAIPPGDYMVPRVTSSAEMRSPEYLEKMKQGPVLVLTVMPNEPVSMGKSLALWFLYVLAVSIFAAYIGSQSLAPGADYMRVFQMTSATAFIGYAVALWQMSIWYQRSWSLTLKATLDGLIYSLLTGGAFGWLWPA
jgi:hypothetical protein